MGNGSIDALCAGAKTYSLKKKKVEKALNIKLEDGVYLGLDTAMKTGWAMLLINKDVVTIEGGSVDLKKLRGNERWFKLVDMFLNIIKGHEKLIVIEDTFYKINPFAFKVMNRIGIIAFTVAYLKGIKNIKWKFANSVRKSLGFEGKLSKKEFQKQFLSKIGIEEKDNDFVDAIALALFGAKKNEKLQKKFKKRI